MDAGARTRRCCRTREREGLQGGGGSRQICLNMTRETYDRIWENPTEVRALILEQFRQSPQLFPAGMEAGFRLTGRLPESAKLSGIWLRQLRVKSGDGCEAVYTLRPCFVMPYMAGFADELQYPLELLAHGVPTWLVAKGFGHTTSPTEGLKDLNSTSTLLWAGLPTSPHDRPPGLLFAFRICPKRPTTGLPEKPN